MEPHLTADNIAQYREGKLAPPEILSLREHIDSCAECRAKLAQSVSGGAVLRAWIDPEPDEQALVLFAAGKLSTERSQEIEAHLKTCDECRDAVADLRSFAAPKTVVEMPARRSRPVPLWWGAVAAIVLVGVYGLVSRSAKPKVVATLHDSGANVTVTGSGDVSGIAGATQQERVLIAEALRTGKMPLRAVATPQETAVLRGGQENQPIRLLEPMGRRMLTDRPEFLWSALDGASSYEVTVFTEDEKIIDKATVTDARWQPQAALPRGGRLNWQVAAIRGSERIVAPAPPAPRAWFEIVSKETADRLAALRESGGSNLRLAIAYAQEGLQVEAATVMRAVIAENPDSEVAKQLRDSLRIK
jgi:anti-sigma factor RsiW